MNKFDDIKLPKNIKEETKRTIKKARHLKLKKKNKILRFIAIIILSIGVCACELNYSLADGATNLHKFIKNIKLNSKDDYLNYGKEVNLTERIRNISITINETSYDGHKIYFTYTIKSNDRLLHQTNNVFYKDKLELESNLLIKNGTATDEYKYFIFKRFCKTE